MHESAPGPWPTPLIRSRVSPLTGAHPSHPRQAVEAVLAPAYDPERSCPSRYSMTSSAIASRPGWMAMWSAFAVLRLITNSNLVGCNTGKSLGLVPLRMRPT